MRCFTRFCGFLQNIFPNHTKRCVTKSKTVQQGTVELNLEVRLLDGNTDFVNSLAGMEGIRSAVLVSYNGEYMG